MTESRNKTCSAIIERELCHPPQKVWKALTRPELIADWLMENNFQPQADYRFRFTAEWGTVDCRVMQIEPERVLAYTWEALGIETVVTWTLEPTRIGTRLTMEQSGFRGDQKRACGGAKGGWSRFFDNLEITLGNQ